MIKSKKIAQALFELAQDASSENLAENFFDFIKSKKLEAQIPSIFRHLNKIIEQDDEKNKIKIEVAQEIQPKTIQTIKEFMKATTVNEKIILKKELLGGFRVKWQGKLYDSSFLLAIRKLEKSILK